MATAAKKSIQSPDETRTFDKGHVDLVTVGDLVFGKATFEPGWKWSECVKPMQARTAARCTTTATSSPAGCIW
jgi:hypothetical protein